jgi:hypothetical protein
MPNRRLDLEFVDGSPRLLRCQACGRALGGDPEDDPMGENGQPLCGECNRARNFDVELEELSEDDDNLW